MYFNEDQIWAPTVYIEESQAKGPTLFNLPTTHLVLPDGTVTFGSSGVLETSCSLDMTYFPYDYQSCKFGFGILDSSRRDVNLVSDERGPQKSANYVQDGEWAVHDFGTAVNLTGMKNYEIQTLYVILKLQRRSTYYVLNVIVPAVTVSLLSLLTFVVPVESGERLAYALTNLLSLSVYITYIGSIMPSSSVDLPIILRYLVSLFIISSMCVVMTVIVIAVRWSRVVIVSEKLKCIFIFGFPFTLQRKDRLFGVVNRSVRAVRCLETNPSVETNTESTSMCSSELQSLCESPQEKVVFDESFKGKEEALKGKEANKKHKPMSLNSLANNNVRQPLSGENPRINHVEEAHKVLREPFAEFELINAEMDPDIVYICSRLDLVSFAVLVISFLVMTVHSFVMMNQQTAH
ncbi:unnamed protein product [Candidula unifasciata]|uniref:Uncharacterized protein n=1 Tax=Candidula unifasciata TaxID=100452 RepID=A0A8S4AE72_9EUPU|nr:unnamed protein product [Candidula unifasciata]